MLTSEDGFKIAKKLDARIDQGKRKHIGVTVVIDDVTVGRYGLSRSSREQDHNYIAKQIGKISPRQAINLSRCPLSKEGYVQIIKEKGVL